MSILNRIREKIVKREYYLSSHAEEELAEDNFNRTDLENAILTGRIEKKMTKDLRGTRYRIEGPAKDGRKMHIVCRFKTDNNLIIITVYDINGVRYEM